MRELVGEGDGKRWKWRMKGEGGRRSGEERWEEYCRVNGTGAGKGIGGA
jgi:hypothetical protein